MLKDRERRKIETMLYFKKDIENEINSKLKIIEQIESENTSIKSILLGEKVQGKGIFRSSIDVKADRIENLRNSMIKDLKKLDLINSALLSIQDYEYYSIIDLKYFKRKSIKEIAHTLNIDRATVFRQLDRLLKKLKSKLL